MDDLGVTQSLPLIPGLERSLGEGNGYVVQYTCLENSMDRGAWRAMVHRGHKELDMTKLLTLSLSHHSLEFQIPF